MPRYTVIEVWLHERTVEAADRDEAVKDMPDPMPEGWHLSNWHAFEAPERTGPMLRSSRPRTGEPTTE